MIHLSVAKLFFIIFSFCCTNTFLSADSTQTIPISSISCSNIGNTRYLELNSSKKSLLAVFYLQEKWYIIWDTKESISDISLPPKGEWPTGLLSLEKVSDIQTSRPCLIFSFKTPFEMMPMVTKTEKGWSIHIVSEYFLQNNPNPNQISFDLQNVGQFRIVNAGNASFITLNMPTKEELSIILTEHPDTGLDSAQYAYVDIHESVQGGCLYLKSDQLFVEKQNQDAAYYPIKDPLLCSQEELKTIQTTPSISFIQSGDFTGTFRNFLAVKAVEEQKQRPLHLSRQAWVEIALGEGDEAMQTILLLGRDFSDFSESLAYQIILGISQCLSQKYKQSLKTLAPLPNTPEINLWKNISKSQIDERAIFDENIVSILKKYPTNLREYILIKIVPFLFDSRQIRVLKNILQEIVPQTESLQAIMSFHKAMYIFTFEDREQGYKLLLPIANKTTPYSVPPELESEARLETYFHDHGNDPIDKIITDLDILRTQARGYDIEVKICLKLIEQLEKKKNYIKIIEILQDLSARFKKFDVTIGFHQLLSKYLKQFFITNSSDTSPTKVISLFVRYKSTIIHYPIYDEIAEHVASLYEKLNLLDKSISLFAELAAKTKDSDKKTKYQLKIAQLYIQNFKPQQAINLLADIHDEYKKQASIIFAKAYCLQNDYHSAIHWLQQYPTKESLREIANIYIEQEDYPHVVNSLKDYLAILKQEDESDREQALVELAATYNIQKKPDQLKELFHANKEFMKGRKSEKIFAMFCHPHAEHLQTIEEVYEYIHDGDILKEILESHRVHK